MPHRIGSAGHHGKGGLVMNCCNAYGQCTQGHDCPCRTIMATTPANKPTSEPIDAPEGDFVQRNGYCVMGVVALISSVVYFYFN